MVRNILINNKLFLYIASFIVMCDLLYIGYVHLSNTSNNNKNLDLLTTVKVGIDIKNGSYPIISQDDEEGSVTSFSEHISSFRKRPKDGYIIDYEKIVSH